jgi:AraC-like DNA-binding protein
MSLDRTILPVERLLHWSDVTMVGVWRCPPDSQWFRDSGPARNHVFVFPRTILRIVHARKGAVVTDPGVVTLYNRGDDYRREALCGRGDECEWFSVAPEILEEAVHGVPGAAGEARPFPVSHVFSTNAVFLQQRRVVSALLCGQPLDPLCVEEAVLNLLDGLVSQSLHGPVSNVTERHVQLVCRARRILAARFTERLRLAQLAGACGVSPWFLARIFRRVTGTTVHDYHERLRLRAALDPVSAGHDLSALAHDLGFASHSHFTESFRRAFGVPPSGFRRAGR